MEAVEVDCAGLGVFQLTWDGGGVIGWGGVWLGWVGLGWVG